MILLDPDLDPDKAASRARRSPASSRPGPPPSLRSLSSFLRQAREALRLRGEVSVLLTTDKAIRTLNRDFRGKDKSTDVLSFPAEAGLPEEIAGDLAISVETARRQAAEQQHSLTVEIKVLILHGLLHLAGYDHETDQGEMARREQKLRVRLGLPAGLIGRAAAMEKPGGKPAARRAKRAPGPSTTNRRSLKP